MKCPERGPMKEPRGARAFGERYLTVSAGRAQRIERLRLQRAKRARDPRGRRVIYRHARLARAGAELAGWDPVGLLSKDEETILEGSASLIERARAARADKAQVAWSKATEYLEKHKAKVRERR